MWLPLSILCVDVECERKKRKVSRNAFHSVYMVLALAKNYIVEVLLHNEIQVFFLVIIL